MPADVHPLASFASPTLTGVLCERVLKVCGVLDVANDLGATRVTDIDQQWAWQISSPCGHSGLVFLRVGRDFASIARLYTSPEHRHRGLASGLIERLVRAADDNGVRLRLYCQPYSLPPEALARYTPGDLAAKPQPTGSTKDTQRMIDFYGRFGFSLAAAEPGRAQGLMTRAVA